MGQNNPYRSSSDDQSNASHKRTSAEHHTGGHMGAGKSGAEDLGTEKRIDDERFGSNTPHHSDPWADEGKKDAPGKNDESYKRTNQ